MMKANRKNGHLGRITALMLILALMLSLIVPFEVSAEEGPATGNDIYAFLYYIDPDKYAADGTRDITNNLELVIQRGNEPDSKKTVFRYFYGFAASTSEIKPWYRADVNDKNSTNYGSNIMKVDIKDKVAPTSIAGWFYYLSNLTSENLTHLENIDTSQCTNADYLFIGDKKLTSLDLSTWNVSNVTKSGNTFNGCIALTDLDISTWELPKAYYIAGMFSKCTSLEHIDISSFHMQKAQIIGSLFNDCTNLKSVELGELTALGETQLMNMFKNCTSLEEVDLSGWNVQTPGTFQEMFYGCTNLKSVNFGPAEHWGKTTRNWSYNSRYEKAYELMFGDCKSLESLDLTCVKGALLCSSTFKGCANLKEINLSYAGTGRDGKNVAYPDLTGKANIFEGCEELSMITLSAEGWPESGKAGTSVPPKSSWRKIDAPNKDLRLSGDVLFQQFQPDYAGTWIADSFISFRANGGSPANQTVDGNKGIELVFDEQALTPTRIGYDFTGWWTDKTEEPEGASPLHSGDVAESWSYFAHWTPHTYTLVLDGNGGTVPDGMTFEGGTVSADRKTITFSDISYPDFVELNSNMFKQSGKAVLSSWNTRSNGNGTQYFVSDSVNQLTPTPGGSVTLFAQWDEPDFIVTFDSDGGTAINNKSYKQSEKYGNLPIPEKAGYTFLGWYPENSETAVSSTDSVTADITLHAHWAVNPKVYFHPNDGTADDSPSIPFSVYKTGQKLGVLPTPEWGTRTFNGWYTEKVDGAQVTSDTVVNAVPSGKITYYAHWGYKPVFETDGGTFTEYDASNYGLQEDAAYTIDVLPEVVKEHYDFEGWFFQYEENGVETETEVSEGDDIDLSKGTIIKAKWTPTTEPCTVTCVNKDPADPDNPSKTVTTEIKVYKGEKIRQLPVPSRSGYEFKGWYKEGAAEPETVDSRFNDNTVLNAVWEPKSVVISFNANGGTITDVSLYSVLVSNGGTIEELPNAILPDKILDGWYLMDENGEYVKGSRLAPGKSLPDNTVYKDANDQDIVIPDNLTYYALWEDEATYFDEGFFKCAAHWTTESGIDVTNLGDTLVYHPTSGGKISAHLNMSFERVLNKVYVMPARSIKIKMPVSVFKDKDGNEIGTNNIDGDELFERSTETINGRQYYVYTNKEDTTNDSAYEFHYDVLPTALAPTTDGDPYYHNDSYFYISYHDANHNVEFARDMRVEVHTGVTTTVSKSQYSVSLVWDPDWGDEPADANEYFYVIWHLSADNKNCSQSYRLRWSEDTVHNGTVIDKSGLDVWSDYLTGGTSTATVVTKHSRSEVDSTDGWYTVRNEAVLDMEMASGELKHYRVSASALAYVPDTGGSGGLTKVITSDYTVQTNHTKGYAQEYIVNGKASSLTPLDYTITYREDGNTDPGITWSDKTNTYTTAQRTLLLSDGNPGDLRISKVTGSNKYKWGDSSIEQNLNTGDYSFTSLKIYLTEYDAVKMNDTWSNPYKHRVQDYGEIIVRVKTTSNNNLEVISYDDADGLNDYIQITLPEGTYYYEIEHKTSFFTTDLKVETSVKLNLSNRLQSIVADHVSEGYKTLIKNKCELDITRNGITNSISSAKANDAWPASYELTKGSSTLYTFKRCGAKSEVTRDGATSSEYFPVLLTAWNYNTGSNTKTMKSGEFNDLLPPECSVDKDSVFVKLRNDSNVSVSDISNETKVNNAIGCACTKSNYNTQKASGTLPSGNYSVVMTPDWQGSGRTMMTVRITVPEGQSTVGFNVFYLMKTSYSNINRRGIHMMNSTSFTDTTHKQSKPNQRINTIDLLDSDTKQYFTSLDDEYTAYAKAQTDCIVPSIYTYGISSRVLAEGSHLTEHETVGLNSNYTYNINYSNNANTEKLVFFDTLEKRVDGTVSDWYGVFKEIDVSQIKTIMSSDGVSGYCRPEVYYATKDRELFEDDDFDLDCGIWSKTPPSDLSKVTAVAVDCRKTDTGENFVLAKKQIMAFNINMHSPDSNVSNNDVTYNEAVVRGMITDNDMEYYSYSYTDVTIKFSYPRFTKLSFPSGGTSPQTAQTVVLNSVLEYYLEITNPDETMPMLNVTVEDIFDNSLNFNNPITVSIDEGEEILIDDMPRISSYSINPVKINNEDKVKFSAVISSIEPDETVTIKIPVTVTSAIGTILSNTAQVTSFNDVDFSIVPFESNEVFHEVTGTKAKIIKIKKNGDALSGAQLQIFENNSSNFDTATGKIKPGAVAMVLKKDGVVVGEGSSHDYFTSTSEVQAFDIAPGKYVLHEKALPAGYETAAADIPFRVDIEGMHYVKENNKEVSVSRIEMVNEAPYQVIYHTNPPAGADEEFSVYDSVDLIDNKVPEFSETPQFKGDTYYYFTGWFTAASGGERVTFDRTYTSDTNLYAHWTEYKVVFHTNNPNGTDAVFKTVRPKNNELNARNGIDHFYDIPAFAGDEYVFAGWYHNSDYTQSDAGVTIPADFEKDVYLKKAQGATDPDYHLYAKWIEVGTVEKSSDDTNLVDGYRGFGLSGVQIREENMSDSNHGDQITPGGLRFVTSLSEDLLGDINSIDKISTASAEAKSFGVEYGYVVGTQANVSAFKTQYGFSDSSYKLQYNGENVNGVNTTGANLTAATDYRYISNVDCTSRQAPNSGTARNKGVVARDHRNFGDYRLYTLVVTYEGDSSSRKDDGIDARAYIRYYDANGKQRVFYNNYSDNASYYGGCLCSYNQVSDMNSQH